jgi:hypothetical protein
LNIKNRKPNAQYAMLNVQCSRIEDRGKSERGGKKKTAEQQIVKC